MGIGAAVAKLTGYIGILGDTTKTPIGNVGDRLKVDALSVVIPLAYNYGNVFKKAEVTVTTKVETDFSGTTYTVPSGKTFVLTTVNANFDSQSPAYVRLKKQTGGAGAWSSEFRLTVKQHGQDNSNVGYMIPLGVAIGVAGDVFKLTYESSLAKGSLWAGFTGIEF